MDLTKEQRSLSPLLALRIVTDLLSALLPRLAGFHQAILAGLCAGNEAATLAAIHRHDDTGAHAPAIGTHVPLT